MLKQFLMWAMEAVFALVVLSLWFYVGIKFSMYGW
jgi:hypothetical protein